MKSVVDGYLSGRDVCNHLRDEERIELGTHSGSVYRVVAYLLLKGVDSSDADTEDDADFVFVDAFCINAAVLNGLHGCHDGILFVEVHFSGLFTVDEVGGFKIFYFAGKLCLKL